MSTQQRILIIIGIFIVVVILILVLVLHKTYNIDEYELTSPCKKDEKAWSKFLTKVKNVDPVIANEETCAEACKTDIDCVGYTMTKNNQCYLYGLDATIQKRKHICQADPQMPITQSNDVDVDFWSKWKKSGAFSSPSQKETNYFWSPCKDLFWGINKEDYGYFHKQNTKEKVCSDDCANDPRCEGWKFNWPNPADPFATPKITQNECYFFPSTNFAPSIPPHGIMGPIHTQKDNSKNQYKYSCGKQTPISIFKGGWKTPTPKKFIKKD